jgi:hypothetical protein
MLEQRELSNEQLKSLAVGGYAFAIVDSCVNPDFVIGKAQESGPTKAISL